MMPPTRIEQLNNFQDAVQSPDGLDRLRALQSIEQALPSSQGLMGMPQVQAPMPMVPRQYGGEVGTGGLVEVLNDGTQVFSNTEEGILNRSIHGGMLQGQQQTATAPSGFSGGPTAAGTLASGTSAAPAVLPKTAVDSSFLSPVMQLDNVQQRGGIYNASDIRDAGITLSRPSDAPETIVQQGQAQVGSMYRDPVTGKIPYALYQPQPVNTFGQGYDLKDMDYFTANALALNEGADRFIYNDEYAAVDPGLLSNYNYSKLGTKPWGASIERDKIANETFGGNRNMHGGLMPVSSSDRENARLKAEGFTADRSGRLTMPGTPPAERFRQLQADGIDMSNPYTRQMFGFKHGGSLSDIAIEMIDNENQIEVNNIKNIINKLREEGRYDEARELENNFNKKLEATFEKNLTLTLDPNQIKENRKYTHDEYGQPIINKEGGGQIADTAEGLASFGRYGDNILVHMNPEELEGLASLGQITYNPVTGLPEAFSLGGIFKSIRKLAPVVLGLAAPVLFGGVAGALGLGGTALGSGITGFIGSGLGSLIAGAKPKDALKAGLMGGVASGALAGIQGKSFATSPKVYQGSIGPTLPKSQVLTQTGLGTTAGNIPTGSASQFGNIPSGATTATNTFSGLTNTQPMTLLSNPLSTIKSAGQSVIDQLGTTKGLVKAVGMDLMTPDYNIMYANEAKAKEQALRNAGYTVDTGFDGQTVIRDSSGVTMPRNLTPSAILNRALGRTPRTNLVARYGYGAKDAKEGGLISLKHGGEFSGMVPGEGHGMEDNVYMPIKEGSEQVGTLAVSPSEYVVDSYTMAALGNGNADAGAKVMDRVVKHVRKKAYGDTEQPNEISGLQALKPMMERV